MMANQTNHVCGFCHHSYAPREFDQLPLVSQLGCETKKFAKCEKCQYTVFDEVVVPLEGKPCLKCKAPAVQMGHGGFKCFMCGDLQEYVPEKKAA